ncbi:MAG: hypothetical protein AABW83_04315 [Nanoarchaeota archaeon]
MLNNIDVYVLKPTEDGKLTIDRSDPFNVNYNYGVENVLIFSPYHFNAEDISRKVKYFIQNLPSDKSYKVIVDSRDSPEISDYKKSHINFIVNAHKDPERKFEFDSKKRFRDVKYMGLIELEKKSYEDIVLMFPIIKRRNLEEITLNETC